MRSSEKPFEERGKKMKNNWLKNNWLILVTGLVIGIAALVLGAHGNPGNMGFCIACFLRDTTGALGMHGAEVVQYFRPEIVGILLGSLIAAVAAKEFKGRGGSSPIIRFILGVFVMIGALMFLGCPLRMVIRIGGGDWNALVGLAGFIVGILVGVVFLKKGFTLGRSYKQTLAEGAAFPIVYVLLFVLWLAAPAIFKFSEKGPGSMHAAWGLALVAGLVVGALCQRSRMCMVGGIRNAVMFKDFGLVSRCSSATSFSASSTPASPASPLRTATVSGTSSAPPSWAGAACCSAAARCVSSFSPVRARATAPSPFSA